MQDPCQLSHIVIFHIVNTIVDKARRCDCKIHRRFLVNLAKNRKAARKAADRGGQPALRRRLCRRQRPKTAKPAPTAARPAGAGVPVSPSVLKVVITTSNPVVCQDAPCMICASIVS
jgi:hypothetical protein